MPKSAPPSGHVLYELGKLIAARRVARGLHQGELADRIGVSIQAMRAYESGMRQPPIDTLIRIARACGTTLSALLAPLDQADVGVREVRRRAAVDDRGDQGAPRASDGGSERPPLA